MLERDLCRITIDLAVENYFAHPIGINSEGAFLVSIFMHRGFHAISKGGLVSERFSLWLKSPMKSAKSLR